MLAYNTKRLLLTLVCERSTSYSSSLSLWGMNSRVADGATYFPSAFRRPLHYVVDLRRRPSATISTLSNHPECICGIRHLHCCRQNFRVLHLQAEELGGVLLDEVLVGEGHLLELLGVRSGDLSTGDTDGRSVQVVEGVFGGESNDLGGDTE